MKFKEEGSKGFLGASDPLLKTLCAHATYPLVLLSKSERFNGLGVGLIYKLIVSYSHIPLYIEGSSKVTTRCCSS